jgi:hypothetical protein
VQGHGGGARGGGPFVGRDCALMGAGGLGGRGRGMRGWGGRGGRGP